MNKRLITFIFLLCATSLFGQRYKEKQIRKDLQELTGFENAFVGFVLFDPEQNKVLADHLASKHLTPASITKLFTYWASSRALPNQLPALEYTVNGDSLIFWSTGYPLTLHPDEPDSTVINFLSEQEKHLVYWPRPIADERYGPGWGWDDFGGYYGAEKSVFPIYGNSVEFILNNEKEEFQMSPNYKGFQASIAEERSNRARVYRDEFWNEFEIKFDSTIDFTQPIDTLIRPFRYADHLFVDLLSQAIKKPIFLKTTFERPSEFSTVNGVAADSLYKWMLQPSDNLFAESLLLMTSGMRSDTLSTKAAIAFENDSILSMPKRTDKHKLVWVDGSGLSRYNMFTPNQMTDVLYGMYLKYGEELLFELLPQGGISGTLEDNYAGENGQAYVFAKTGTLSNNHTLSGFIKTSLGKTLIFTLMANHYTCSTDQVKENFEVILRKIRSAY